MGDWVVTVRLYSTKGPVKLGATTTKELLKPPWTGEQGSAKEDWVTEWAPGEPLKTNWTMSPLAAVTLLGVNLRPPLPTWMVWTDWEAAMAARETTVMAVANIVNRCFRTKTRKKIYEKCKSRWVGWWVVWLLKCSKTGLKGVFE